MSRTKKIAVLAIIAMLLCMIPAQVFAAASDANADSLRLAGIDRIETALAISHAGWDKADAVVLAPSNQANLVDALAAAPLAGQAGAPILLTPADKLDASVKARIAALGAQKVYVVGAIADSVAEEVEAMTNVSAVVLKGANRTETAAKINELITNPNGTFIVGYNGLADALSVASFAAKNRYAIMVADQSGNLPAGQQVVGSKTYKVGGTTRVADSAPGERLAGDDRFETNLKVAQTLSYDYKRVYVANGFDKHLVDSLAVAPLAAQYGSFVALADNMNNQVKAAEFVNTKISGSTKVIAVGGLTALSDILKAKVGIDTLVVESAEAINLKQIEVKFNKEVNEVSAETASKYELDDQALDATNLKIDLQADKSTVLITLGNGDVLQNGSTYKFSIDSILGANGDSSAAFNTTVKYTDTTVPYITEVKVLESKKLRVVFNEPVADMGAGLNSPATTLNTALFEVEGGVHPVTSAVAKLNLKAVDLEISTPLQQGQHEVTFKPSSDAADLQDFAGYAPVKHSKIFTMTDDTTAPTVSVISADETEVRLQFSESVKNVDKSNVRFRHTYNSTLSGNETTGNLAASAVDGTNNKEWIINFTKAKVMPTGTVNLYIGYISSTGDKIEDNFGNVFAPVTLTLNVVQDKEAPVVESVNFVDSTHVDVAFNENVVGADIATNYTLKNSSGTKVNVISSTKQTGTNVYRLQTATMTGGTYSLTIANIKDDSLTENLMASTTKTFNTSDKVAPKVDRAVIYDGNKKIRVYFSEAMSDDGLTVRENYSFKIGGAAATNLPDGAVVNKIDNKTIEIVLKSAVGGLDSTGDKLVVAGSLKDLAGNRISAALTAEYNIITDAEADLLKVVANSVKATAPNKIEFKVNMLLSNYDAAKITLGANLGGGNPAGVAIVNDVLTGRATVTLTLAQDAVDTSFTTATDTITFANGAFTTLLGGSVTFTSGALIKAGDIEDYARPSDLKAGNAVTVDADGDGQIDGILITYSENINTPSVAASDYQVEGYVVKDVQVSGKTVLVRIQESGAVDKDNTPKVTQVGEVADDSAQHNVLGPQAPITPTDGVA
ncbi:MAG: cell wall-binding repeat-containing protein [Desulfitobacteriia bacterium]